VLQSLTETAYVAPAIFAPLAVLATIRLVRPATRAAGLRLVTALAVAAAVLAPVSLEYYAVVVENPDLSAQTVWTGPAVTLWWSLPMFVGQEHANQMAVVTMLLVVVGMAVACFDGEARGNVARRGAWATGVLWFVVGAALSIGGWAPSDGRCAWHCPRSSASVSTSMPAHRIRLRSRGASTRRGSATEPGARAPSRVGTGRRDPAPPEAAAVAPRTRGRDVSLDL
jgi:hypothetical protein